MKRAMTWVIRVAKVRCQHVRVMAEERKWRISLVEGSIRGRLTIICTSNVSRVNGNGALRVGHSRNLAVSKIHLLKSMTVELKAIHVLHWTSQCQKSGLYILLRVLWGTHMT